MTKINEVAAQIMEHLCTHSSHGYTQGNRLGDGGTETITIGGKKYTIATGDRDCSSAVIDAYKTAIKGTKYEGKLDGATYTGNMRRVFVNSGLFEWMPMSYTAQRGDIYLNEGCHTAMCTSADPDMLAEFSISENGTIYGKVGDQTGNESRIRKYYNYPWDGILRCKVKIEAAGGSASSGATSSSSSSKSNGKVNVTYSLKRADGKWWSNIKNFNNSNAYGYAGNPETAHCGFKARVDKGSIRYRVHEKGGSWSKEFKDGAVAQVNGTIDGIKCYYTTPRGYAYQYAWYRSQTAVRNGYLDVCCDYGENGCDGWAGIFGENLDRFQLAIAEKNPF